MRLAQESLEVAQSAIVGVNVPVISYIVTIVFEGRREKGE